MDYQKIIQRSIHELHSSNLPNLFYGKNFFFYSNCVGPKTQRNQLIGYLGGFSGFNKLSNEVDVCIIPTESIQKLRNGTKDSVLRDLSNKLQPKDENKRPEVIPETLLFFPEKEFFSYIRQNLLIKDPVREKQFERINFSYS